MRTKWTARYASRERSDRQRWQPSPTNLVWDAVLNLRKEDQHLARLLVRMELESGQMGALLDREPGP